MEVVKKSNIKNLILIFIIGCVVGYIYEEIFYLVEDGKLVNRGFLYGPYLPVYGVGAVFLDLTLKPFKKNPFIIFILSIIVTGIVEYITGFVMWQIWHKRWWDYTGLFLNIDGYICLRSLLSFAVGALALIYIIDPYLVTKINKISNKKLNLFIFIFSLIFIIDVILSFLIRNKF